MAKNYGILQAIFNLDNEINLTNAFSEPEFHTPIYNSVLKSIDAKGNVINASKFDYLVFNASDVNHLPKIKTTIINYSNSEPFYQISAKYISIEKPEGVSFSKPFNQNQTLEKIDLSTSINPRYSAFSYTKKLRMLPKINWNSTLDQQTLKDFIVESSLLYPTDIDLSENDNVKELDIYGTSTNRVDGLKSLKVSTEAPFDDSTSPQINVSYTGLNRNALVELFNSLPTVSNGQTIDITGCTGTSSLTNDDKAIATNKGWTITGV